MLIPHSQLFAPIKAQDSSTTAQTTSGQSSATAPSNQLSPNSFITLLTTQLQAQDPLNPLDPTQMVNELTTMNSFQQLLQIRQDLDGILGASQANSGSGTPAGKAQSASNSSNAQNFSSVLPSFAAGVPANSAASLFANLSSKISNL